ncbi:MAG: sensor histidine kinase [Sphingomonadaceae bacterium]
MPLGLVALLASLEANRAAQHQRLIELNVVATDSARRLATELVAEMAALRFAANWLENGGDPAQICVRLAATLGVRAGQPTPFALFGASSAPVCSGQELRALRPPTIGLATAPSGDMTETELDVRVPSRTGSAVGVLRYSPALLAEFAHPALAASRHSLVLSSARGTLVLRGTGSGFGIGERSVTTPVGLMRLDLTVAQPEPAPQTVSLLLLPFLPLLMWASAAAITFFVADRLLIRPLRALRAAVSAHEIGADFRFAKATSSAREIRELGDAFARYAQQIATKEATLAQALAAQTRATREVHHRVKNNIQIVASLISLHARAASSADAATAYAAIQRRVDAMAVVQRNHYADADSAAGIDMKPLIAEIAMNLRISFGATSPHIALSASPLRVSQDGAIALAFLATELVELAVAVDPTAAIAIELGSADGGGQFTVQSNALADGPAYTAQYAERYGRVIDGLVRQLRAHIERDRTAGSFVIVFPSILGQG